MKPMLKTFVLIATWLLISLLAGCSPGGRPTIGLPQQTYDFGQVQQGDVSTIQLPVRNTGRKDLRITSVTTSCGCTSATVEPMTIAPGTDAVLTINYDSGLHPDEGPIWRIVYIASNDPDTPEAKVEVRGNVTVPQASR
jgi:hypothetical protein